MARGLWAAAGVIAVGVVLLVVLLLGSQGSPSKAPSTTDPAVLAAAGASWQRPCGLMKAPPARWQHVIWIWFENQDYAHAVSGPAVRHLVERCGVATRYWALTHPSLPNYVAAVSGSEHGITKNCNCPLTAPSLMQQAGSWRLYAEAMPSPCDATDSEPYESHHNFAVHFRSIDCQANDVPLAQLGPDLAANRLPRFSFILPDACHSMHYTKRSSICHQPLGRGQQIAAGNQWLAGLLPQILGSQAYRSGTTAIFISWDEGFPVTEPGEHCLVTRSADCRTAAVVIAPSVVPHTVSRTFFTHYSLLRTTEQLLGIRTYLGGAATAPSMRAAFGL
ncbi:MAG TPA: alkaline phosphatase family protein [Gaiellales bacterium]|nr:alkaline phosphatase family protein [Gaiellales bacterium]